MAKIYTQIFHMLYAAEGNVFHLEKYFGYAAEYSVAMSSTPVVAGMDKDPKEDQIWTLEMIALLIEERTKSNPSTFNTIAMVLNRMYRRDSPHRQFTTEDCKNKWHKIFPTTHDAVATVNYLNQLKEIWPDLQYHVEKIHEGITRVTKERETWRETMHIIGGVYLYSLFLP